MVSTFDIKKDIKFEISKQKQFMGVKQVGIDSEVLATDIIDLMNKYPRVFFALSFSTPDFELKIKAKAPKSAKPSTKTPDGGKKADFCSLKTTDRDILGELFFDLQNFQNFKEIKIRHTLKIQDIIYPKGEKDPIQVREKSKRKGILVRSIDIDGNKQVKEASFEA